VPSAGWRGGAAVGFPISDKHEQTEENR